MDNSIVKPVDILLAEAAAHSERKTLAEWLEDPRFTQLFAEMHWQMFMGNLDGLKDDYELSVNTLRDVAVSSSNPNARVNAAKAIMNMAHRAYDRFISQLHMKNLLKEVTELRKATSDG